MKLEMEFNDLKLNDYALALSPGFFCFYSLMGFLNAVEEEDMLRVSHVSGSSAGALVAGFLSSGMKPHEMIEPVFKLDRKDMWDIGGIAGLLRGKLFQNILETNLPITNFSECKIPLGVTAYDILRFRTNCIKEGHLATAIRASCSFPGLFQPVLINGLPHIDGGVFDWNGVMALPGIPQSKILVNVVFDRSQILSPANSYLEKFGNIKILSIVLENMPPVTPFTMSTAGPLAYSRAKSSVLKALRFGQLEKLRSNHWSFVINGAAAAAAAIIYDPEPMLSTNTMPIRSSTDNAEESECPLTVTPQDINLKTKKTVSASIEDTYSVNEVKVEENEVTEGDDDNEVIQKVVVIQVSPPTSSTKKMKKVRDNSDLISDDDYSSRTDHCAVSVASTKKKPRRRSPLELLLADSKSTVVIEQDQDQDHVQQTIIPMVVKKAVPQTVMKAARHNTRNSKPRTSL